MKKKTDVKLEVNKEAEEWKNKYLRVLADYQNLDKRVAEEKVEIRKFAAEVVLMRLLPAIDTLSKAKAHLQDSGLDLSVKEFETALAELGIVKIDVLGKEFNPHEMECIDVADLPAQAGGPDNQVIEELLPGYKLHDKILRVAQVKVGKQSTN